MKQLLKSCAYLLFAIFIVSCGGTKSIQTATGAEEVSLPFSESKYKTDKENFRSRQSGTSPDLATSKKIALQNAKSELASNIKQVFKIATSQYTNQRSVANAQEYENKFEEQIISSLNETLTQVVIVEEKVFKEKDGSYTSWVVVEKAKSTILEGANKRISSESKLQLDYDKKKFEEIFNNEMEKLAKGQ
jgi:hypothetical protein